MKKFILIGQQGSGNRFISKLLASHPQIDFAEEFLNTKPQMSLENAISEIRPKKAFNIKYDRLFHYGDDLASWLNENDYGCLHLIRDPARCFIRYVAKYGGTFNKDNIRGFVEEIKRWRLKLESIFDDRLDIYYEDLTRGKKITKLPKEIEYQIEDWLDIERKEMITDISNYRILEHL